MNAAELSLENYVFDTINKRIVQIHGIEPTWNEVWVNYANGSGVYRLGINKIEPIPLTEEWLLKFGFNKRQDYFFLKKNSKYYFFWNKKDGAGITTYEKVIGDIVFDEITIIKKLKFVHQLQNLYFALTGSELTIKE